jgi:hypothetical protein
MTYQVCWSVSEITNEVQITNNCVKRIHDGAIIPFAEDNTDYQEYLAWLAEGNEPLPADD